MQSRAAFNRDWRCSIFGALSRWKIWQFPVRKGSSGDILAQPFKEFAPLSIALFSEQEAGAGEDAEPLVMLDSDRLVLGVFDGMGGAGCSHHMVGAELRTEAFLASRLARAVVAEYFESRTDPGPDSRANATETAAALKGALDVRFSELASQLTRNPQRLTGSLIRTLPTTMAALQLQIRHGNNSRIDYGAFWAGDSRAYTLSPYFGLQQLTVDDIASGGDALHSLLEDSRISNVINGGASFVIRATVGDISIPAVFLVATDGCFGYVPTPAHFEQAILDCLIEAVDAIEWQAKLKDTLAIVAGDDFSLALVAIGWKNFARLKNAFGDRRTRLMRDFIDPYTREVLRDTTKIVDESSIDQDGPRQQLWSRYKITYEMFQPRVRPSEAEASMTNAASDENPVSAHGVSTLRVAHDEPSPNEGS